MNDHNLDDLIIDDIQTQPNSKIKGILTILALLIIVLIVAVALTQIILKDPQVDSIVKDNSSEIISPELKLQSKHNATKEKDDVSLDEEDTDINTLEDNINDQQEEDTVSAPKPVEKPIEKPVAVKPKVDVKNHKKETVSKPKVDKVVIDDKFEQVKAKPKPIVHRPKPIKPSKPTKVVSEKYYIQVGSFSQQPSGKFLGVIKNSGFNYTVLSLPNGMKKFLIGPYPSRQAVDKALPKVRDRINKGAFVYKVK